MASDARIDHRSLRSWWPLRRISESRTSRAPRGQCRATLATKSHLRKPVMHCRAHLKSSAIATRRQMPRSTRVAPVDPSRDLLPRSGQVWPLDEFRGGSGDRLEVAVPLSRVSASPERAVAHPASPPASAMPPPTRGARKNGSPSKPC